MKQLTEKEIKILARAPEGATHFIDQEAGNDIPDTYFKCEPFHIIANIYGRWTPWVLLDSYFLENEWRAVNLIGLRELSLEINNQKKSKIDNAIEALIQSGFNTVCARDCVETLSEKGLL